MWWPYKQVHKAWLPRVFAGADEWGNKSVGFVVPPFGCFILFYQKTVDRSKWFYIGTQEGFHSYISPDYRNTAYIEMGHWSPEEYLTLSVFVIARYAHKIERTDAA